ncbi:MAG: hypothetical protein WCC22_06950 [Terriglobales bacterium]
MCADEHFEELSALAALGQISEEEYKELVAHNDECPSCCEAYHDYCQIVAEQLPSVGKQPKSLSRLSVLRGNEHQQRMRFFERARREGVRLSEEAEEKRSLLSRVFPLRVELGRIAWVGPIVAMILLCVIGFHRDAEVKRREAAFNLQYVQLVRTSDDLRAQVSELSQADRSREDEVMQLQQDQAAAAHLASSLQQQASTAQSETLTLREGLRRAKEQNTELQGQLRDRQRQLGEMNNDLERLRSSNERNAAIIGDQEARLGELSAQLRTATESSDRDRQLMANGRDIRDLMGARNLHIVDVYDADDRGRTKKAFGRVFYTEGKTLIFYAFDLADRDPSKANHSFQAWGQQEGTPNSARSLGIFYTDDLAQKRWVLKVSDQQILEEIDSVFVTLAPFGGGIRPNGQRLLYAYLGNQANHP